MSAGVSSGMSPGMTGFTAEQVPDQTGRTVMVTGANTGIGYEVAKVLAARGARVLLACRSEARAQAAMARIRAEVPGADLGFVPLDQADLASVRAAAAIAEKEPHLDVLVNNAGVMYPPLERTVEGHELQFGVNHLGTYALTGLLLGKLAQSPDARVVTTASIAHFRGKVQFDDIDAQRSYNRFRRYSDSKLMNLLFGAELDRRLRAAGVPVTSVICHPGVAATELMRHVPGLASLSALFFKLAFNTAEQGAWPALQAATMPGVEPGGYYGSRHLFGATGKSAPAPRSAAARDREAAARLWTLSQELTGVDYGLPPG